MRAIASRCVRGNLVGFLSRGGIPPGLVGFLSPSVIGAGWRLITVEDGACTRVLRVACTDRIRGERTGGCVARSPD